MHYYELFFNPTDELVNDGWSVHEDGMLDQTFYVKTEKPWKNVKKAKKYLRKTFAPSNEFNVDLVNCLKPGTVKALAKFEEIDGAEFESCCGVPA